MAETGSDQVRKTNLGKIVITPRANNLAEYSILDLIVRDGRAYLSKKNENKSAVTVENDWLKITENAYDIAVRLGLFKGTEAEWIASLSAASEQAAEEAKAQTALCKTVTSKADTAASNATSAAITAGSATEKAKTVTAEMETVRDQALAAVEVLKEMIQDGQVEIYNMKALQELIVNDVQLAPSRMEISYLRKITRGNPVAQKIDAKLFPAYLVQNVMFQQPLNGGNSVYVDPHGNLEINQVGKTRIHVVPTNNTKLSETVEIEVVEPSLRLSGTGGIRQTSDGKIRLT